MPHYYDNKQAALNEQTITVDNLTFFTASGLFSKDHLDNATKLLIEKADVTDVDTLCDLGCGWGAVSILLKRRHPKLNITAIDLTDRAIKYTKKNAEKNKVTIDVIQSDVLKETELLFDCILTNPPYNAGRKVCFRFIEESFKHLNEGGSLQLVARHQKGGKMLGLHMEEVFGNCEHIAKSGGFRIYKSIK